MGEGKRKKIDNLGGVEGRDGGIEKKGRVSGNDARKQKGKEGRGYKNK